MSTETDIYLIQAVTIRDGQISTILRERVARSAGGAELEATAMLLDLELFQAGACVYINGDIRWDSPMTPGAPRQLHVGCMSW